MIVFSKMQGIGNDFIIINCINQYFNYSLSSFSKYLCNRNFGVGADGVIYIFKSYYADCKIRIYNNDGTEAEMCGNGIRCVGKYLYEKGIVNQKNIKVETIIGTKDIELVIENKTVINVKAKMNAPCFEIRKIPAYLPKEDDNKKVHTVKIPIDGEEYSFDLVSIGNPHAVCFTNDLKNINIKKIGELVENYKYFPNKTNVEFVQIVDKKNIKVKVWERGVGETLACGTGACAATVVGVKNGLIDRNVTVELDGGKLYIDWGEKDDDLYLMGECEFVYDGKLDL